jgi:hypothetical protein
MTLYYGVPFLVVLTIAYYIFFRRIHGSGDANQPL